MVQYVITLANSVIGVSVLALPFCFQQCGIVLATLMLICSAIMTRVVCHFLLKGGTISRRRTYELLAYHTYGPTGKLLAELTIIGFLLGTLIAFLVVMGDLGPQIVSEILGIDNDSSLRTIVMTGLALFVALPLGLLKNIDSLGSVSIVTLMFYVVLVCKILSSGVGPLWAGTCLNDLNYWRPAGILQCIPIFAMALSCQTQIFPIYDSLPEPTLSKMNSIVKRAVYLCTSFYFCVGFFGYVAFCSEPVDGNILVNFKPTGSTQFIKCCFVFSIAFSVPLVVLPCRASLHSMIWRDSLTYHHIHEASSSYIPEGRLRFLTVVIIGTTLVIGLMIPNIELVLGLVGSTAGSVICIIFPALMFISVTPKNTTEKLVARAILVVGVVILVMTTYATLYAVEKANVEESQQVMKGISPNLELQEAVRLNSDLHLDDLEQKLNQHSSKIDPAPVPVEVKHEEREEPPPQLPQPQPPPRQEPAQIQEPVVKLQDKSVQQQEEKVQDPPRLPKQPDPEPESVPGAVPETPAKHREQQPKEPSEQGAERKVEPVAAEQETVAKQVVQPREKPLPLDPAVDEVPEPKEPLQAQAAAPAQAQAPPVAVPVPVQNENTQAQNQGRGESERQHAVPAQAIQPQPPAVAAVNQSQAQKPASPAPAAPVDSAVAEQLLKQMEKQQEEQRKLIEEQKQVLAELKKHHEEHDQADAEGEVPIAAAPAAVPAPAPEAKAKTNVKEEPVMPVQQAQKQVRAQLPASSGQGEGQPAPAQIPVVDKGKILAEAQSPQLQKKKIDSGAGAKDSNVQKVSDVDL